MKSIEDSNPLYSLEKLRQANDLLYKWSLHFKFQKNNFLASAIGLYKNKSKFSRRLSKNKRQLFIQDCKTMFYALEVENEIIKQYYYLIIHIMKKLSVDADLDEYYKEIGLHTLRQSIWSYRSHESNVKFITYCFNGVSLRLKGERSKLHQYRNRLKRRLERLESDIFDGSNSGSFSEICPVYDDPSGNLEQVETNYLFMKAIQDSNLKEDETFLLMEYMNRDGLNNDWNKTYRKKYTNTGKDGNTISRQGVHNKLMMIQRKVYLSLTRLGYNFNIVNTRFAKRYNEFEVV